jgi:hypothetical protein
MSDIINWIAVPTLLLLLYALIRIRRNRLSSAKPTSDSLNMHPSNFRKQAVEWVQPTEDEEPPETIESSL